MLKQIHVFIVVVVLLLISACGSSVPTEKLAPTRINLQPPPATATPEPTLIPQPGATSTPKPTFTPSPSPTPVLTGLDLLASKGWQLMVDSNGMALFNLDGTTVQQFFERDGSLYPPCWSWSQDGNRIIYYYYGFTDKQIDWPHRHKITKLLTGETIDLPVYQSVDPYANQCLLRWHPQDKAILLEGFLIRPEDGSLIGRVTDSSVTRASWSPDGKSLAFATSDGLVHVADVQFDANGKILGVKEDETRQVSSVGDVEWSPNGDTLAIINGNDFFRYHLDDNSLDSLTQGFLDQHDLVPETYNFSWSPDGKLLAFSTLQPLGGGAYHNPQVFIVNADGSGVEEITGGEYPYGSAPIFSPDGEWVFYSENTSSQVVASKLDGSERVLLPSEIHATSLGFRPGTGSASVSVSAGSSGALTQTPQTLQLSEPGSWRKFGPTAGLPLRGMQAVFDSQRRVVVLFGGTDDANHTLDQTWEFDGNAWRKVDPPVSPLARFWHGMAYDSGRGLTVLYGGEKATAENGGGLLDDTWEYDGSNWIRIETAHKPEPRGSGALLTYDSCRARTVLFGGSDEQGQVTTTWEYDGKDWSKIQTRVSPPGRNLAALVFDEKRCQAVLFGGGNNGQELNDTWEYDGSTWKLIPVTAPPPVRWGHAMAFNPLSGHTVLFGGYTQGKTLQDTWIFDGVSWKEIPTLREPSARQQHSLVFDGINRSVMCLSGYDSDGNWAFSEEAKQSMLIPQSTSTPACGTGWTRLKAGDQAILQQGDPNWVREEPRKGGNTLGKLYPGTIVKVLEGPVCADGLVFWKVQSAQIPSVEGWTAEGDGSTYWLEPYRP